MSLRSLLDLEDKLQEAIKTARVRESREVRQELEEVAKRKGFSLDDIFGRRFGVPGYRQAMSAKFRNPENAKETWSGRGRKPNWMLAKLDKGAKVDDFRV